MILCVHCNGRHPGQGGPVGRASQSHGARTPQALGLLRGARGASTYCRPTLIDGSENRRLAGGQLRHSAYLPGCLKVIHQNAFQTVVCDQGAHATQHLNYHALPVLSCSPQRLATGGQVDDWSSKQLSYVPDCTCPSTPRGLHPMNALSFGWPTTPFSCPATQHACNCSFACFGSKSCWQKVKKRTPLRVKIISKVGSAYSAYRIYVHIFRIFCIF